eukprot:749065-Hanusia_phi.AAC.2
MITELNDFFRVRPGQALRQVAQILGAPPVTRPGLFPGPGPPLSESRPSSPCDLLNVARVPGRDPGLHCHNGYFLRNFLSRVGVVSVDPAVPTLTLSFIGNQQ